MPAESRSTRATWAPATKCNRHGPDVSLILSALNHTICHPEARLLPACGTLAPRDLNLTGNSKRKTGSA
jgi:hypothetical protein